MVSIEETAPGVCRQQASQYRILSQYAVRLFGWAKKHVTVGQKRISAEQLRKVIGLESVKDVEGNIIQEEVPSGFVVTETTKPRSSTFLSTFRSRRSPS